MYESEYSSAVETFIAWLEQNSNKATVAAARTGADVAVKNITGSEYDYDNGLGEIAQVTETMPVLEAKIAEIAYSAQWDDSLCHTAEFFVDTEEIDSDGNPLRYTENEQDAAQVLYNHAQVWHDVITPR